jgi:hypothetical protein
MNRNKQRQRRKANKIDQCPDTASCISARASGQVVERKRRMKFYWDKLITVSLSEAFIVSSESSMRLISCFLRDRVIHRFFGLAGEMGTV